MNGDNCSPSKWINHVLAEKVFVVDFHSEVSEMSLSQYRWPRRKNCKSEKVYLEENEIKLVNISL